MSNDELTQMPEVAPIPIKPSADYLTVMGWLHNHMKPRTYLEIGTNTGESLRLCCCDALAIDPNFKITGNVVTNKPSLRLFQMASDDFFRDHDPEQLFGSKIDLAFIDGMHLFEFVLRDFANVEKFCRPNSVIAIHDVLPSNTRMAERIPYLGEAWTGDVWKTILAISKFRPDLCVLAVDAPPTGLILITNLNPKSTILHDRYFSIVDEYSSISPSEHDLRSYRDHLKPVPPQSLDSLEKIAAKFWL